MTEKEKLNLIRVIFENPLYSDIDLVELKKILQSYELDSHEFFQFIFSPDNQDLTISQIGSILANIGFIKQSYYREIISETTKK